MSDTSKGDLTIQAIDINLLKDADNNNKNHPPESVSRLAKSMDKLGQIQPVICDKDHVLIAGHGRVLAAKELGWSKIKAIVLKVDHETARRMRIADNLMTSQDYNEEALLKEINDLGIQDDLDSYIDDKRFRDLLTVAIDPAGEMSSESIISDIEGSVAEFAEETDELMDAVEDKDTPMKSILGFGSVKPRAARRIAVFMAVLEGKYGSDKYEAFMQHVEQVISNE